jgi:hypothetical protein
MLVVLAGVLALPLPNGTTAAPASCHLLHHYLVPVLLLVLLVVVAE